MEGLVMFAGAYRDKVVWLSGHTGFKGGWLASWLRRLGAHVHGFALPAEDLSFFNQSRLEGKLVHETGDVRDPASVRNSILRAQPDFVFHLAAQPLVRYSYEQPLQTHATNIMGTAHVLEALRLLDKPCGAVLVTTDKCYENREADYAYAEEDHLGGHDPYSSSKAAAEIVIGSYRRSFFAKHPVRIASARAGNVIGGGDWAMDRIIPDCIRSLQRGEGISVRNPDATRPWQHVLEPLGGYLWLGALQIQPELVGAAPAEVSAAFNFGPEKSDNRTVREVVEEVLKHWPGKWVDKSDPHALHEARLLMLSTAKAKRTLHWSPTWHFEEAMERTISWYREFHEKSADVAQITLAQIEEYEQTARSKKIEWASS